MLKASPEGGHHLLLELGRGGSAQVFLAVQSGALGVDKLVVLKFLRPDLADYPDMRETFLNEARFSARLNHANIVQTSAIIEMERGTAIVMEYLEGQTVSSIRARARAKLPLEMHLRIIIDVLRGLHYAHELTGFDGEPLHVVHRDVSPHNVFVTYDGQVKLIDFGIAKLMRAGVETATGVIKGKVGYMPAEQLEGRGVDRRADLYAVGVMLWEAATGEKMWRGMTDVTIMHRVLNGDIPRLREASPDIPDELERIILKALAFAPEDRYATAPELEVDLEVFLGRLPPVTNRDIGRFVSREFADVRAETKRIIDQEMMRRSSRARSPAQAGLTLPPPLVQSLARAGYATASGSETRPLELRGAGPRPWTKRVFRPLTVAAALAIGCIVAFAAARSSRPPLTSVGAAPLPAGPLASPLPAAPAAVPSRAEVDPTLGKEAAPPSGAASAAPPVMAAALPAMDAAASARAAAPSVKATAPAARAPVRRGVAAPPAPPAAPAPTPTPTAPAKPSREGCEPPYTIDAEGIKRFKVECM
ncbi:uncharacterized protein SOCE26_097490 [Sorangium cellulosum]|uniref:non-specific serine/threonine protein kinase n=1 Tax=Sorangium cellulosum TaxID=56 RepID=A0A2L0F9E9_SORCE|nr:serine/threonine-protein kinase [Sorangium cellulosum]AUX48218.1 uncharacterized protein SOCE26_097490 [Sorangium cellulosum]